VVNAAGSGDRILSSSLVYGPVPSRRLGRSLGINNIPPKKCSYSCVYCQLGRTVDFQIEREAFYEPLELARGVRERVRQLAERGEHIDYLAFVPDGEPTLDVNLGKEIGLIRSLDIRIAVINNGSLLRAHPMKEEATVELLNRFESVLKSSTKWSEITV
jgi:wyosine [tRNA(Phe)-imidazoG37] synthetase (radical SAM superfamily)